MTSPSNSVPCSQVSSPSLNVLDGLTSPDCSSSDRRSRLEEIIARRFRPVGALLTGARAAHVGSGTQSVPETQIST